jgi:4-amino-4-deoxy-L-arabinose transferase-like glycosyltransferase
MAAVLTAAWLAADGAVRARHGLTLEIRPRPGLSGPALPGRTVSRLNATALEADRTLPRRFFGARWSGWWRVRESGLYEVRVRAHGKVDLKIDGAMVATLAPDAGGRGARGSVSLAAGAHVLEVDYDVGADDPFLKVLAGRSGGALRPLDPDDLYVERPTGRGVLAERGTTLLGGLALLAWFGAAVSSVNAARAWQAQTNPPLAEWPPLRASYLVPCLVMAITAWGVALRGQALVHRAQEDRPYEGDPYTYLQFAREMRGFYDAHVREPVFVAATKAGLAVAHQQDVGISLASAFSSSLTVPATYWMGAVAFSPAVGLLAALLLAVESRVVGLSAEGWRDDTFALTVVLCACALLSLLRRPTPARAVASGLAGAAACLTRLTSLSFLLPAHAWLAVERGPDRGRRAKAAAIALLIAAALIAPYLINCAVAFGDPLFAVNYHTGFYRYRDAQHAEEPANVAQFLFSSGHPYRTLERGYIGLTSYPFANKWTGFDRPPRLGPVLAASALGGLVVWLFSAPGRLLLVILLSSLVPFAFTWDVPGGAEWRFTLHAYPFYLVAAALFLTRLRVLARPMRLGRTLWNRRRTVVIAVMGGVAVILAGWWLAIGLRYLRFREDVRTGEPARLEAGPRDRLFMGEGWYGPTALGNVKVRLSRGRRGVLDLPLTAGRNYALTLRLDPFQFDGAPPQTVRVALNGSAVAELPLQWDESRIGSYAVHLPASRVREGRNTVELEATYSTQATSVGGGTQEVTGDRDVAFLFWYLRVEPAG